MPRLSRKKRLETASQTSNADQPLPAKLLTQHEAEDHPHDLWDRAYESLREDKDSRKLMDAYEKILLSDLNDDHSFPAVAEGTGTSKRERDMSALVEKKVKAVEDARWNFQLGERTVEIKTQVDRIVKAILFAKDFVSSAVSAEPHAALAWAGVCMLLPLLLNPELQKKALVEGLDYISSLVVRFTTIERLYHQQGPRPRSLLDQKNFEELNRSFEAQLTKLYSQILIYQAQVVCQMRRPTFIRSGRDILKLDDWSTSLEDIKKAEAACTGISQVVGWEKLEATLEEVSRTLDLSLHEHAKQYYDLQHTTDNILMGVEQFSKEQQQWHRTDEESRCLQALCTSTYEDHKDRNPARVPGTCLWFLENKRFGDWLASYSSDLLWVTADPGCGKSVLSRSLIDNELQSGPSRTTCYFFFKDVGEQRSATNAICALLHQLCTQNQSVLQQVVRVYQSNGNKLTLSFSWLWKAFLAATSRPEAGEIVCILDALDECEEEDKVTLIESLNNTYTTRSGFAGRVKFLVTSRPYYDIEDRFNELVIRLSGEDESEQIGKEIDLVIKDRVPKIAARKKFDRKTQDALQERLLATESRTYLWLYLALADIEKAFGLTNPKKMREFVDRIPKSVDEAYEAMLNRSPEPEQARKLLHIVLAATRPLNLREVNMAFNLEEGQKSYDEVDLIPEMKLQSHIKNVCGLILTIQDSCIYLLHQTAKEFLVASLDPSHMKKPLVSNMGAWKHTMESSESNLIFAKICITYLLFSIFESDPLRPLYRKNPLYKSYMEKHYFLSYAAKNWPTHFRLATDTHELSQSWCNICNTESNCFRSWLHASNRVWYVDGADSFDVASFLGHDTIVKQLLRPDTDLEKHHATHGGTVLARAADRGYHAVVDTLISHKASINTEDASGRTPLHYGVESGSETVVDSLLQAGAFVDGTASPSQTPLHIAASKDYEAVAKILLCNGASLDVTDYRGQTPLLSAIRCGSVNIVNMLLDKGASMDVRDEEGRTPLFSAIRYGSVNIVNMLLDKGASMDVRDEEGRTPLFSALKVPSVDIINTLLDRGASMDIYDKNGRTPLFSAIKSESVNIVNILLDKGACVDVRDNKGLTPLSFAAWEGNGRMVNVLLQKAQHANFSVLISTNLEPDSEHMQELMFNIILREASSLDIKLSEGMTVLHWAAMHGRDKSVQELLEKGASVDIEDEGGSTALIWAARQGHAEVVRVLVAHGAKLDVSGGFSCETPLMYAAQEGHKSIVQILLENGARVNFGDNDCQTALHYAALTGDDEITRMLLDAGADPNALDFDDKKPLDLARRWKRHAVVELLEPLTNDDYERPSRNDESEADDNESEVDSSYESDEENEAGNHEPEGGSITRLTSPFDQKI